MVSGHEVKDAAPDMPRCSIMPGLNSQVVEASTGVAVCTCVPSVAASGRVVATTGATAVVDVLGAVELLVEALGVLATVLLIGAALLELVEVTTVDDVVVVVVMAVSVLVVVGAL